MLTAIDAEPDRDNAVQAELAVRMRRVQVGVLYDQLVQGLAATVLNAAILAYILSGQVGSTPAWVWFAAILLTSLGRAALLIMRRRSDNADEDVAFWENWFLMGTFATACMWGCTSLFLFPADSLVHQAFIGFVLAGMTSGAVSSFSASHRVFLTFMLPACVPYVIMLFLHGSAMQTAMGLMVLVFIGTTWVTSKKTNITTTEALRLRFENLDLVSKFEQANEYLRLEVAERERAEVKMKALVEEVTAATNAKSHFLANMSHEIRTPMNGVIGMSDILSRSQLDRRQRHQVSLIQNSAQTLLSLLNDILDFSRIEAGRIELDSVPFEIREVVADAVDVLADQAESKGLELAYEVADDIDAQVTGDPMRLRQILINLIGNAVKFTEKGSVVLRVTSDGLTQEGQHCVRFAVSDTGIGIDPKVRKSLFDPFKQADPSVTRRFGGSGLGLSISYHLVDLMGGSINCNSTPGEGSEFFFFAPFEADTSYSLPEFSNRHQILAADENTVTLEILGNYLRSWKLDAVLEQTGEDVLRALEEAVRRGRPFSGVIASASLSDMSGLELASRIRSRAKLKDTKVILLTPVKWSGDMHLAETRNIVRTINKPVRQSQLFEALSAVVREPQTETPGADSSAGRARTEDTDNVGSAFDARVLLVEDNPVNQEVAAHYLRAFGCTIEIAESGVSALTASRDASFDLIFMDCQMPNMDGFTATRRIREREESTGQSRTPIVALTASAFAGDREQCLSAGMDDYVSKPFVPADLETALKKWLSDDKDHTGTNLALGELPDVDEDGAENDHDALDSQQLRALKERSAGLLQRLVELYLEHAPPLIEKLRTAQADGDGATLKSAAHALKSSSSNVAAAHLAELCQLLEVKAQTNDVEAARELFAEIEVEFGSVVSALKNEVLVDA